MDSANADSGWMAGQGSVDDAIRSISEMERDDCKRCLRMMNRSWMDFSEDFLDTMSLEKLRHIVLAAWLQVHRGQRRQAS